MRRIESINRLFFALSVRAFVFLLTLGCMSACVQDGGETTEEADMPDPMVGAWGGKDVRGGEPVDVVVIFTPAHQVAAWFNPSTGSLIHSNGGLWSRTGNHVTETVEFDTDRPERAGTDVSFDITLVNDSLSIVGSNSWLVRINEANENVLEGSWELLKTDDEGALSTPSKHVRMMSSSRFQEIEYEPESGVVLSITGGSYRIDGKDYVETIFFHSEAIDDMSTPYILEREGDGWSQKGADRKERVWQGR